MLTSPQDEVLIGKDHPVVLSVAAPKEVRPFYSAGTWINNKVICHHLDCRRRRGMSRSIGTRATLGYLMASTSDLV